MCVQGIRLHLEVCAKKKITLKRVYKEGDVKIYMNNLEETVQEGLYMSQ